MSQYAICLSCSKAFAKTGQNCKRCPDCRPKRKLEYNRERYHRMPEALRAQNKTWRDNNRARLEAYTDAYYLANKADFLAGNRRRRENNPEQYKKISQAYYQKVRVTVAIKNRERKYGVATASLYQVFEGQGGACAICHLPLIFEKAHTDHDHATKLVRGLLCRRCNLGLSESMVPDNLIRYLREVRLGQRGLQRPRPELGTTPLTISEKRMLNPRLAPYCESCGFTPLPGKRGLHKDHCHTTGIVRGHLCLECNKVLGLFDDSIERLERAKSYLLDPPAPRLMETEREASRRNHCASGVLRQTKKFE